MESLLLKKAKNKSLMDLIEFWSDADLNRDVSDHDQYGEDSL